ncbi:MAG: hypothetical protein EDM79_15140, partial [Chloroflexi bacterium]
LEKPEGRIFIIPLRLEECTPPRRLLGWHYADYFPVEHRELVYQRLQQSLNLLSEQIVTINDEEEMREEILNLIIRSFTDAFQEVFKESKSGKSSSIKEEDNKDIFVPLSLSFGEAVFGTEKVIEFQRNEQCQNCKGSSRIRCTTCNGRGETIHERQTFLGKMIQTVTCPTCNGSGEVISSPCSICQGKGTYLNKVKRRIVIPAGVDTGVQILLAGEGHTGKSGKSGNVLAVLTVEPHPFFVRDQSDVIVRFPVPKWLALHGGSLQVPLLQRGKHKLLSIPSNTQNQKMFRIIGAGIPKSEAGRGDLLVIVDIFEPKEKTQEIEKKMKLITEHIGRQE